MDIAITKKTVNHASSVSLPFFSKRQGVKCFYKDVKSRFVIYSVDKMPFREYSILEATFWVQKVNRMQPHDAQLDLDAPAPASTDDATGAAYLRIAGILRERLRANHYLLRPIPSLPLLAREFDVSVFTIRRAVAVLVDEGRLRRQGHQLLHAESRARRGGKQIALLAPAAPSGTFRGWLEKLRRVSAKLPCTVRLVPYQGWHDPVIPETLDSLDGVFFHSMPTPPPASLLDRLRQCPRPLAVVYDDFSEHGLVSIREHALDAPGRLMDHLHANGHRRFACFNIQAHDDVVRADIAGWRAWMDRRGFAGPCWDRPYDPRRPWDVETPAGLVPYPLMHARHMLEEIGLARELAAAAARDDDGYRPHTHLPFTAVFSPTSLGAYAMIRALHEVGVRTGRDAAVVTLSGEAFTEYAIPTLTTVDVGEPNDPILPLLERLCVWMIEGGGWTGPRCLEPSPARVHVRESSDFVL